MRADEHEGDLNDTEVRRQGDRMQKRARWVQNNDINDLTEGGAFLRWFGKFAYPAIFQDFPVNNGSSLAEFMGRRQLTLEMISDLDRDNPGFVQRLLAARADYEKDLLAFAQQKEK
jgi:hypothetical protein